MNNNRVLAFCSVSVTWRESIFFYFPSMSGPRPITDLKTWGQYGDWWAAVQVDQPKL